MSTVAGVLLAAGEGRRAGGPKALRHDPDGISWLRRSVAALDGGGCDRVVVVLGAGADEAERLLDGSPADIVWAADWATGMSASLRAALGVLTDDAALVHLVDLPDVGEDVVRRVLAAATGPAALARASYSGAPGHPVLLGRDHWPGVLARSAGDRGAKDYLASHDVTLVECGDLATGRDVDHGGDHSPRAK